MNKAEDTLNGNAIHPDSDSLNAMQSHAIEFAEWINEHKWIGRYDNMWYKSFSANDPITTEQLYTKFNSETTT